MMKRKLLCIAIMIMLAATGCQHVEQQESAPAASTKEESVSSLEQSTAWENTEAEESESSAELTTLAIQQTEAEKVIELEYVLDENLARSWYYFEIPSTGNLREEDGYYTLTGSKIYPGPVVLNWEQKALLDAGAVLKIMYQDKEVDRITARIGGIYYSGSWHDVVQYRSNRDILYGGMVTHEQKLKGDTGKVLPFVDLEDPLYRGVGFYLSTEFVYGETPLADLVFEENVTLKIPGDTVIEPHLYASSHVHEIAQEINNRVWTIEEYYQTVVKERGTRGTLFIIYEEEGEVVRIVESMTP